MTFLILLVKKPLILDSVLFTIAEAISYRKYNLTVFSGNLESEKGIHSGIRPLCVQ